MVSVELIFFAIIALLTLQVFVKTLAYKALVYVATLVAIVFSWNYISGKPKLLSLTFTEVKGDVLAHSFDEPNAIYYLVGPKDNPTLYKGPWNESKAAGLEAAALLNAPVTMDAKLKHIISAKNFWDLLDWSSSVQLTVRLPTVVGMPPKTSVDQR